MVDDIVVAVELIDVERVALLGVTVELAVVDPVILLNVVDAVGPNVLVVPVVLIVVLLEVAT